MRVQPEEATVITPVIPALHATPLPVTVAAEEVATPFQAILILHRDLPERDEEASLMPADAQAESRTAHVAQLMATMSIIHARGRLVPATTLQKTVAEPAIRRHVHPEETTRHRTVRRLTALRREASLITAHLPAETIRPQAEALSIVRQAVLIAHQVTVRRPEVTDRKSVV